MKRVAFSGFSDDLVCLGNGIECDEIAVGSNGTRRFLVGELGCGVIVSMTYAPRWLKDAQWAITVVPSSKDSRSVPSIPEGWSIAFENSDRSYSMTLVVVCPEDTLVRRLRDAQHGRSHE